MTFLATSFRTSGLAAHISAVRADVRQPVADLFARQFAVAARPQLLAAGVDAVEYGLRTGREDWVEVCPGVVQLRGAPFDWRATPMAATLASPHVAVTAGSALRVHRLDGFDGYEPVKLIARRGVRPLRPPATSLGFSRRLGRLDLTSIDGIRVTNVATSLVHALRAAVDDELSVAAVEQALDHALRTGTSPGWIAATIARWSGRGVSQDHRLQSMLDDRGGKRLPRSWFERLAGRALAAHGLVLEHEYPLRVGRRVVARFDLAHPPSRTGLECQSWRWHASPGAQQRDLARKRMVRQHGWELAECWWSDRERMDVVAADVVALIQRPQL